jgi:hypothetical protein
VPSPGGHIADLAVLVDVKALLAFAGPTLPVVLFWTVSFVPGEYADGGGFHENDYTLFSKFSANPIWLPVND